MRSTLGLNVKNIVLKNGKLLLIFNNKLTKNIYSYFHKKLSLESAYQAI